MQFIISGDLVGLISSLESAQRYSPTEKRAYLVRSQCLSTMELVLMQAKAYRDVYPERLEADDRQGTKAREREFYEKHCIIRLCKEGTRTVGGYCVLRGELLALHNQHRHRGQWMLQHAIDDGAKCLSCFDNKPLVDLYTSRGFVIRKREPNWEAGGPDVLYMELPKA